MHDWGRAGHSLSISAAADSMPATGNHSHEGLSKIQDWMKRVTAALGLTEESACSCCGTFFRRSEPGTLFEAQNEKICIACVRDWWPRRYGQLDAASREILERRLADWLIRYHHGRTIREYQEVLQVPLQEFLVVADCKCGGEEHCRLCDGHGTLWVVAPE